MTEQEPKTKQITRKNIPAAQIAVQLATNKAANGEQSTERRKQPESARRATERSLLVCQFVFVWMFASARVCAVANSPTQHRQLTTEPEKSVMSSNNRTRKQRQSRGIEIQQTKQLTACEVGMYPEGRADNS